MEFAENKKRLLIGVIYQSMAWLFIALLLLSLYRDFLCLFRGFTGNGLYYIQLSLRLVLLVACIGAVTHKIWAANLMRVVGLCLLVAVLFPVGPAIFQELIENVRYGPPVVIGGGPDFKKKIYLLAIMHLICLLLFLALIITAHIIARYESKSSACTTTVKSKAIKNSRLLVAGIIIFSAGLFLKWLDSQITHQHQPFAFIFGSYFLVAGVAILLVWQIMLQNFFIAASTITLSGVLLISAPTAYSQSWTLALWSPLLVLGVVSFFREKANIKLRTISLIFPLILVLIIIIVPFSFFLRFSPYEVITSNRPENFPRYLQVPENATDINYRGGNNPDLYFTVNDPYPATQTLGFIADKLEQAGWKKLNYDLRNPEFPSSHIKGWSALQEDHDLKYKHHTWMAGWINDKDETLRLILKYRFPEGAEEDLTTLYCHISQSVPNGLDRVFIEHYKGVHPNTGIIVEDVNNKSPVDKNRKPFSP